MSFDRNVLQLNVEQETERIVSQLRHDVSNELGRRGVVLGVSGGVDSAVCLALAVKAFGSENVVTLLLPEKESSPESTLLGRAVCKHYGVEPFVEEITGPLTGFGCYQRRDEAISRIFPEYDCSYRLKITLPSDLLQSGTLNIFSLTIVSPEGIESKKRLRAGQLRSIVAATNFKQRCRAAMLYYHAELRDFAVIGTPPKNEHELGFFVKYGDSAADVKPIVHLYKTQVYQLAEYLEVPQEIINRPPTSDTYTANSDQQEFFFRLPFSSLDLLWYAWEHKVPTSIVAREMELSEQQVTHVYDDFNRKTNATKYLRTPALSMYSRP